MVGELLGELLRIVRAQFSRWAGVVVGGRVCSVYVVPGLLCVRACVRPGCVLCKLCGARPQLSGWLGVHPCCAVPVHARVCVFSLAPRHQTKACLPFPLTLRFLKGLEERDLAKAQLGLAHSYSRAKVKFNVNKADNMIIQVDKIDGGGGHLY